MIRLLFDEQLSEDLLHLLYDLFPDSLHVRQIGAGGTKDRILWQLAKTHGCLLVSKDADFHRMSFVLGSPPKVIWIRRGNCGTREIAYIVRHRYADIVRFVEQSDVTFMEIG